MHSLCSPKIQILSIMVSRVLGNTCNNRLFDYELQGGLYLASPGLGCEVAQHFAQAGEELE